MLQSETMSKRNRNNSHWETVLSKSSLSQIQTRKDSLVGFCGCFNILDLLYENQDLNFFLRFHHIYLFMYSVWASERGVC